MAAKAPTAPRTPTRRRAVAKTPQRGAQAQHALFGLSETVQSEPLDQQHARQQAEAACLAVLMPATYERKAALADTLGYEDAAAMYRQKADAARDYWGQKARGEG
jgi:hypothetical protein